MLNIAIFFLLFYTSECSFIPKSYPKLGEDVLLACKLTAPDGKTFYGTVPDLTTNNIDHQFNFDEIQSEFRDNRYHGWSIRDLSSTYLQGFIFTSSPNESDFSINFTCFQYVENDRVISASLILANFVQNTSSTTPAMVTEPINSTVKTASTNYSNSTVPPTGCPACVCTWEISLTVIFIVTASLVTCCACTCISYKAWIKKKLTKLCRIFKVYSEREYIVPTSSTEPDNVTTFTSVNTGNRSPDYTIEVDSINFRGSRKCY